MRPKDKSFGTIASFTNILCSDMIERAGELVATTVPKVSISTSSSSLSSVTLGQAQNEHTRVFLKKSK